MEFLAKLFLTIFSTIFQKLLNKMKSGKEAEDNAIAILKQRKVSEIMVQKKLMISKVQLSNLSPRKRLSDPRCVFRFDKCVIRALVNDGYPENRKGKNPYIDASLYDADDNGLHVELSYAIEHPVVIDNEGNWMEEKDHGAKFIKEPNPSMTFRINTAIIARIPYSNIKYIEEDGDNTYPDPHIFCSYHKKNGPFDLVYHVYHDYNSGRNFNITRGKKIDPYTLGEIKRILNKNKK